MYSHMIRTLFSILLLTLIGCASAPSGSELRAKLTQYKTIALVNGFGTKLQASYTGFTIFENSVSDVDISEWKFDKHVTDAFARSVPPSLKIVSTNQAPELIRTQYLPTSVRGFADKYGEILLQPRIDRIRKEVGPDLIAFILPQHDLGIQLRNRVKGKQVEGTIHFAITWALIDAATGKEVFGKSHWQDCTPVNIDFAAVDISMQLELQRPAIETSLESCLSKAVVDLSRSSQLTGG
jgi:hypothetical protein